MSDSEDTPIATRMLVLTNEYGEVSMTLFDKDGVALAKLAMDSEAAQGFIDELDVELEEFRLPALANMRCLGTA